MENIIGHVRRIDELGRVVVPQEYRKIMELNAGDKIEFIIINKELILKKYEGDK